MRTRCVSAATAASRSRSRKNSESGLRGLGATEAVIARRHITDERRAHGETLLFDNFPAAVHNAAPGGGVRRRTRRARSLERQGFFKRGETTCARSAWCSCWLHSG